MKPPRSQLGVKRTLCLTKVEGPFQSTQGSGRGPRAMHCRDACRVGGDDSCRGPGGMEGGSKALRGRRALVLVQLPELGAPRATSGPRETGPQSPGALTAPPQQPHVCVTDTGFQGKGILFEKMSKSPTSSLTSFCRWAD